MQDNIAQKTMETDDIAPNQKQKRKPKQQLEQKNALSHNEEQAQTGI